MENNKQQLNIIEFNVLKNFNLISAIRMRPTVVDHLLSDIDTSSMNLENHADRMDLLVLLRAATMQQQFLPEHVFSFGLKSEELTFSVLDITLDENGNGRYVTAKNPSRGFNIPAGFKKIPIEFYAVEYGPAMKFHTKVDVILDGNNTIRSIVIPHHEDECKDINLAYVVIRGRGVYLVRAMGDVWLNADLGDLINSSIKNTSVLDGPVFPDKDGVVRINCNSSGQINYESDVHIRDYCTDVYNVFIFLKSKAFEYARNSRHVARTAQIQLISSAQMQQALQYQQYGIPYMQPQQPWPPQPNYGMTYVDSTGGSPYPVDWYKTVSSQQQYPYTSPQTYGGCFTQPGFGRMGMPIVPPCSNPSPIPCVPPNLSGLHGPQTTVKRKGPLADTVGLDAVNNILGFNKPTKKGSNDDGDK